MSHTFYETPDAAPHPHISIDVTAQTVWIFQHTDSRGREFFGGLPSVRFSLAELPRIAEAIAQYQGEA